MKLRKMHAIIAIVITIALIAIAVWWNYINSTFPVTINYSNTSSLAVYDTSEQQVGGDDKKIIDVTTSGQAIRLKKGPSYSVIYYGAEGYTDGQIPINSSQPSITVNPEYSKEKYISMMNEALPAASKVVQQKYPDVSSLYKIESAGMKSYGEWYTVKLSYTGDYNDYSDSLRVLLKKSDDSWDIICKPSIVFTIKSCSGADTDTLKWSNELF